MITIRHGYSSSEKEDGGDPDEFPEGGRGGLSAVTSRVTLCM